jgi:hypothetical protein
LLQVVWERILKRSLVRTLGRFENPTVDTHLLLIKLVINLHAYAWRLMTSLE